MNFKSQREFSEDMFIDLENKKMEKEKHNQKRPQNVYVQNLVI